MHSLTGFKACRGREIGDARLPLSPRSLAFPLLSPSSPSLLPSSSLACSLLCLYFLLPFFRPPSSSPRPPYLTLRTPSRSRPPAIPSTPLSLSTPLSQLESFDGVFVLGFARERRRAAQFCHVARITAHALLSLRSAVPLSCLLYIRRSFFGRLSLISALLMPFYSRYALFSWFPPPSLL